MTNTRQEQALVDRIERARERRRAKGDRCLSQSEMKMMRQLSQLRAKISASA